MQCWCSSVRSWDYSLRVGFSWRKLLLYWYLLLCIPRTKSVFFNQHHTYVSNFYCIDKFSYYLLVVHLIFCHSCITKLTILPHCFKSMKPSYNYYSCFFTPIIIVLMRFNYLLLNTTSLKKYSFSSYLSMYSVGSISSISNFITIVFFWKLLEWNLRTLLKCFTQGFLPFSKFCNCIPTITVKARGNKKTHHSQKSKSSLVIGNQCVDDNCITLTNKKDKERVWRMEML